MSHSGDNDERVVSSGVSEASRSLHTILMDQAEPSRPPLFADDLKAYRNNPQSLSELSKRDLATFMSRNGGVHHVIKTLAKDLAEKDAEITILRSKTDKYAYIFKNHLTKEHNKSRLEADKIVQSYFPVSTDLSHSYTDDLQEALSEASADNPFGDQHRLSDMHSVTTAGAVDSASSSPAISRTYSFKRGKPDTPPALSTRDKRGSIFGSIFGRSSSKPAPSTVKIPSSKRNSQFLDRAVQSPKAQSLRSPSITDASTRFAPLEMEQTFEEESLPPPLLTLRQLTGHYPEPMFDNYGFVIDDNRVYDYLTYCADQQGGSIKSHNLGPTSTSKSIKSTPASIASADGDELGPSVSLDSASHAPDPIDDSSEPPTKTWVDYLKIGGTLGLLALVPTQPSISPDRRVAATNSNGQSDVDQSDTEESLRLDALISPEQHKDYAITLRDEISQEYCDFQKKRISAWSRLSNMVDSTNTSSNRRLSRLFPGTTNASLNNHHGEINHIFSSSSMGIASLASSQHEEAFIKFVLGGIPMSERAKIYLENAESKIHYSPEAFEAYKKEFASMLQMDTTEQQFNLIDADINADKGRTLTNNIFYRREFESTRGKNTQEELASLLRAFCVRNPQIGYIQGFNLIAGYLMLAMPTTEKAFWVFCYMIESVLPADYFTDPTFSAMRIDTMVLRQCMRQLMPRLAKHMDELGVPDEQTVPINWLITAFASTLSVEALFRVWDVVLSIPAQSAYLLRVALALLGMNEEKLLRTDSVEKLYQVLDRGMGTGVNIDGLVQASWVLGRSVTPALVKKRREACAARL